jgi:hypothetical protein
LLIVAALALAVGGCGGSDEEGSASAGGVTIKTSSLSEEEFAEKVSAACSHLKENNLEKVLIYLQSHEKKNQTRADENILFASMTKVVVIPTIEKEMAAIRKLGAPSGDEEEIEAFLASEQQAIDAVTKLKSIVSRFQLERYFAESAKLAREYGIDGCANADKPT